MNIDGLLFEVVSDLKEYGTQSDGHPFIGEVFYIQATNERGDRWILMNRFEGVRVEYDPEDMVNHFFDVRPRAKAIAESLVRRIIMRGEIDLHYWMQGRPEYGSEAYTDYGQLEDVHLEQSGDSWWMHRISN